ncbi:MAG: hypothetical protein R3E58_18870 [Phycisphaerae bacterium]
MADKPRCEFVAIDVETANADMSSICQSELLIIETGHLRRNGNPISILKIISTLQMLVFMASTKAPLKARRDCRMSFMICTGSWTNQIAVCHTHFDRVAIQQAFDKYDLEHPYCEWLDSAPGSAGRGALRIVAMDLPTCANIWAIIFNITML